AALASAAATVESKPPLHSTTARLAGKLTELDLHFASLELALPVRAEHLKLHPVAGLVLADQAAQVLRVPDRLAVRGRHDISADDYDCVADDHLPRSSLQPRPGGWAPPRDPDHQGAVLYGNLQGAGHDRRQRLRLGAQVRIDDVAAGKDVRHHPLGGVDRDGKPD